MKNPVDLAGPERDLWGFDHVTRILLEDAGSGMDKVLKCTVFLSSIDAFDSFNAVYGEYFGDQPPARITVVAQKIFGDLDVEMDAIAYVEETQ